MNRKNKELAEIIKQVAFEAQNWHYIAKYNESVVNTLRNNLQQEISHGVKQGLNEGFGDSEVDDAASYIDPNNFMSIPGYITLLRTFEKQQ
jgi:E3 ubiquitin-protein ligase BOI and related proteins